MPLPPLTSRRRCPRPCDRDDFVDRSHQARCRAITAPRRALGVTLPGARNSAYSQPPFRPEAPKPANSARGSRCAGRAALSSGNRRSTARCIRRRRCRRRSGVTGQGGTPFRKPQFAVPEGHRTVAELLRTGDGTHLGCAGDQSHGYVCLPERSRMTPAPSPASVVVSPPPRVPGGRLSRRRGIVAKGQLLPPGRSRAAHSSLSPSPAPRGRDASCPAVCAPVRLGRARRAPRGGPAHTREGGQRAWSWPVPRGPALFW